MSTGRNSESEMELERARTALRRFNPRGSENRRILVTGGLGYTGSAIVQTYREALPDAEICVTDLPRDGWRDAWREDKHITFHPANFFEPDGIPNLVNFLSSGEKLSDAIFIHGGSGRTEWGLPHVGSHEIDDDKVIRLNFTSVYELFRTLLRAGLLNGTHESPATATAVTSLSRFPAWQHPSRHGAAYGKSKTDLYHAMVHLAHRWGLDHHVRIHIVCPGTIADTCREWDPPRSFAHTQDIANTILAGTELCGKSIGVETIVDGGQRFAPFINNDVRVDPDIRDSINYGRVLVDRLESLRPWDNP